MPELVKIDKLELVLEDLYNLFLKESIKLEGKV